MLTWWGIMLDVVDTPYRGKQFTYASTKFVHSKFYHVQSDKKLIRMFL